MEQGIPVGLLHAHEDLQGVLTPIPGIDDPAQSCLTRSTAISLRLAAWWSELQRHEAWRRILERLATEIERETECLKPLLRRAAKALGEQLRELTLDQPALVAMVTVDGDESGPITMVSELDGIVRAIDGPNGAARKAKTATGREALKELRDKAAAIRDAGSPRCDAIRMLWTLAADPELAAATLANEIMGPAVWQSLRDGLKSYWQKATAEAAPAAGGGKPADTDQTPKKGRASATKRRQQHRKRAGTAKAPELTVKQMEAMKLHGECEGNIAQIARRMGIGRKTAEQHVKSAFGKLGRSISRKALTRTLPQGKRGEELISKEDDRRE